MKNAASISLILAIFLFFTKIYAQEDFNFNLGKITQYEMDITSYDKDPEAEALVISERGNYRFAYNDQVGFELYMIKKIKIKIFKQAGIEYATFDIPFYDGHSSWESITDIEGVTYNYENGQLRKTQLEKSSIFEKKYKDDIKSKTFTLPDVKEGSIIELSYTIRTPYIAKMREWDFQKKIPVISSELVYRAIPFYSYTYILTGTSKFDTFNSNILNSTERLGTTEYKEVAYTFGMSNLPAFRDEEFITSPKDYMVRMNMQLSEVLLSGGGKKSYMSTWFEICNELTKSEYFGKYINATVKEAKKILPTLDIEGKSDLEKLKIISDHVKMMYNWNGYYGKYTDIEKLSNFLKQKSGNVANLNLYLVGLLRAANLDANPVIISTRSNGIVSKNHPFSSFFDYVLAVVKVGEKEYFIDATESLLSYNELPSRCINVSGLIVKPKGAESWTFIAQNEVATTSKEFKIIIDAKERKQNIDIKYTARGDDAFSFRKEYLANKEDLAPYFKKQYNIDVLNGVQVENYMERDEDFIASFQITSPLEGTDDKLFIKPFCDQSIVENPFKKNTRSLPIDMIFLTGAKYKSVIEIPDGYEVEYLPKSSHPKNETMTIDYEAKLEGNKIIIEAGFEMNKNIYPASEYSRLKAMYSGAITRFSEMVVLVKKS